MDVAIVTGCNGLIGSQASRFFTEKGFKVVGIDNDMRSYFFGEEASTHWNGKILKSELEDKFELYEIDIRDFDKVSEIFSKYSEDVKIVIHTAAQPSHDWAAKEPMTDFSVNAVGTMNLLECTRLFCKTAAFIFTSTNKVYGDNPNRLHIAELETRYEALEKVSSTNYAMIQIDETMSIDHCKHSIFGASKVSADIMVQEYGKYFGMNTVTMRGGCLTGPHHSGAELHGFLSHLVKCIVNDKPYNIYGYKGKQVRDNIHSEDLIKMFWEYYLDPDPGEVYNVGGGRENSVSIIEAIEIANEFLKDLDGREPWDRYTLLSTPRVGDHIWYITDLTKFKKRYPKWKIEKDVKSIIKEMVLHEFNKQK